MAAGASIAWAAVENALQNWIATAIPLPGSSVIWSQQNNTRPATPFVALRFGNIEHVGLDWIEYTDLPLVFVPIAVTGVNTGTNTLTAPGHGLKTGDGPWQIASTGTVPGGLTTLTNYWAIFVDANTLKVAAKFQNAWVPTPVALTSAGTGTITIQSTGNTRRAGSELTLRSRGMRRVTLQVQAFAAAGTGVSGAVQMLEAVLSFRSRHRVILNAIGVGVLDVTPIRSIDGIVNAVIFEPRATMEIDLSLPGEVTDVDTYIEQVQDTGTVNGVALPTQTVTIAP